jgi:hypothetical protein
MAKILMYIFLMPPICTHETAELVLTHPPTPVPHYSSVEVIKRDRNYLISRVLARRAGQGRRQRAGAETFSSWCIICDFFGPGIPGEVHAIQLGFPPGSFFSEFYRNFPFPLLIVKSRKLSVAICKWSVRLKMSHSLRETIDSSVLIERTSHRSFVGRLIAKRSIVAFATGLIDQNVI